MYVVCTSPSISNLDITRNTLDAVALVFAKDNQSNEGTFISNNTFNFLIFKYKLVIQNKSFVGCSRNQFSCGNFEWDNPNWSKTRDNARIGVRR